MITLYSKTGQAKIDIHEYTYNGAFMGESCITATIKREEPLNFEMGDYVIYKGNPFTLNYIPAKQKLASAGSTNDAFVYESVKFNSVADELTRCRFLDIVANDSGLPYTQLPNFSFTANTPQDLANRLQANLDRQYKDDKRWTVTVHDNAQLAAPVAVSVQNISCWDALTYVNSQLKLNYVVQGREIIIGTSGIVIDTVLEYGKNKGLFQIKQSANADAQIITRLRAYGSTRNITTDYYENKKNAQGVPYIPGKMHVPNLMLPDFPVKNLDPCLNSDNIETYGVREGCVFFDGQNGTKEIYPSIEGVTAKQLTDSGYSVSLPPNDNGNIDEILACDNPNDDGKKQTGDKKTTNILLSISKTSVLVLPTKIPTINIFMPLSIKCKFRSQPVSVPGVRSIWQKMALPKITICLIPVTYSNASVYSTIPCNCIFPIKKILSISTIRAITLKPTNLYC